uniref:Hes family bHLH transcription factor 3 n=1 Tax=Ursus maritimus TaxID=29073 RepID=A0A452VIJ8_URSMA
MEKKRRARINVSLEQLKSLLEKHYSHQIRKRKLEKADILELSVKYMKSLQNSVQGLWLIPSGAEFPSGFRSCLPGVSQLLQRGEEGGGGLRCPLAPERAGGSTMDSAGPTLRKVPSLTPAARPGLLGPTPTLGGGARGLGLGSQRRIKVVSENQPGSLWVTAQGPSLLLSQESSFPHPE